MAISGEFPDDPTETFLAHGNFNIDLLVGIASHELGTPITSRFLRNLATI
jgi:hypothetical protein